MVERCLCKADVSGSSPLISTDQLRFSNSSSSDDDQKTIVKYKKVDGGYLGTQR